MNTATLSMLYQADIQVIKVNDRYVVVGDPRTNSTGCAR